MLSDENSNVIVLGPSSDYRQMFTNRKSYTVSQKLKVMAYADHHSVTAAVMNFSISKSMVSYWKASRDVLEQAPLKARKLGSAPKPHFSREERCLFEKILHKRAHGSFMNVSWGRKNASVYDGLIGLTAMLNYFTYIFSMLLGFSIWHWVVE